MIRNPVVKARWHYRYARSEGCGRTMAFVHAAIKIVGAYAEVLIVMIALLLILGRH